MSTTRKIRSIKQKSWNHLILKIQILTN